MKNSYPCAAFILSMAISGMASAATAFPVPDTSNNFLGAIGQAEIAFPFNEHVAGALGLEGGERHNRYSATLGLDINPDQRIKLTGEYLRQNIDYTFFSGTDRQWVDQTAIGLDYEYNLNKNSCPEFYDYIDLSGYYSHAPSKDLAPISGSYSDNSGNLTNFTNLRRIAGSNAYGIEPALVLHPWSGAKATLGVNYDNVRYDNIYGPKITVDGIGGTIKFSQDLLNNFQLNLSASDRAPFDNYQAGLDWNRPLQTANLTLGILGSYTAGKDQLPDTSYAGVSIKYIIQPTQNAACHVSNNDALSLAAWTQKPAVYMPQVLAIVDQRLVAAPCVPPAFSGFVPDSNGPFGYNYTLNASQYFSGSRLIYSFTVSSDGGPTDNFSIDPVQGILSAQNLTNENQLIVTATNSCGSASSNQFTVEGGE